VAEEEVVAVTGTARTLPAIVADRVDAHGERTILRQKRRGIWQSITWADFGTRVRDASMGLRAIGMTDGDRVAIISDAAPEWIIVDLAILAVGGVSVGVDPTDDARTAAGILADNAVRILFVEGEEYLDRALDVRARCPALEHIIIFDMKGLREFADPMCQSFVAFAAAGRAQDAAQPDAWDAGVAAIPPDQPAIIAEGMTLTHRDILDRIAAAAARGLGGATDERLAFLSMAGLQERVCGLYFSLVHGVVSNLVENAETVPENLREVQPTVLMAMPRVWASLSEHIVAAVAAATPLQRALTRWAVSPARSGPLRAVARFLVIGRLRQALGMSRLRRGWVTGSPAPPELVRWYAALGIELQAVREE
jgi:long-chain acyl-CoA synthetase